jgi:tetratricopeptide (TPR) repeat protein
MSIYRAVFVFLLVLSAGGECFGQSPDKLAEQARNEFVAGKFAEAERDFREITKRDPANLDGQTYLGHALFRQEKYAESVTPYEKARELEKRSVGKLTSDQHRILIDQLVIAYGVSGKLNKAHALLEEAIKRDPEYPLNYYNLACAFAEEGDKKNMLANISLAFQRKEHVLKGEQLPDPRSDSSFQKYLRDGDFVALMNQLGYK